MTTADQRAARGSVDKFAQRRQMLALSASSTIAQRGFANTGLREIAKHSELSHGSLHYYFSDKDDLIAESVWLFKSECARRYDEAVATSLSCDELASRVAEEMSRTLRDESSMHRLWYDLRNQALFGTGFGETIVRIDELLEKMVWSILTRHAELAGRPSTLTPPLAYALVDGMFQHALIRFVRGDVDAVERLRRECEGLILASA
ncbi:HTH-type transcriptional regulator BetI [Microbacterium hydrocarbonoxydans]|uniref:HTH-type transcriptional regulator BetI n=1 Tax=Microbacterium hydrocarbonoxydans TaxID=273678 RepID=A0A0M2HQD0_9MICO|nr:TetR/AcrR family transcriptional regulator [Microbacterium hydrocarbonoxydans]KJL47135.1 HTH-type transcriptional regulator BetI [Microbacterium hydrocarbonoxydans]